ncbi:hypothetical protein RCL_jg22384.t1 [Rhizophagus clarus]|uniref:Uncharacterized protein n=1 Tax=Rhizophagus clarus TaxID=94130 RepID=A0A8H3QYQ0_9GLOM|nr:hypothetical protein RCL_jg22384.t1 [Rhizophagus clarus]
MCLRETPLNEAQSRCRYLVCLSSFPGLGSKGREDAIVFEDDEALGDEDFIYEGGVKCDITMGDGVVQRVSSGVLKLKWAKYLFCMRRGMTRCKEKNRGVHQVSQKGRFWNVSIRTMSCNLDDHFWSRENASRQLGNCIEGFWRWSLPRVNTKGEEWQSVRQL